MRALMGWVIATALWPVWAMGQPLADHVPDDAILYIGWVGTNALQQPYQGTHLQEIMQHSNIPQLLDRALPGLIDRVAQEDPDAAEMIRTASSIVREVWQYPVAFYVRDFPDVDSVPGENFESTFVIDAGEEAESLTQRLNELLENQDGASRAHRVDNIIVISAQPEQTTHVDAPLGNSQSYTAAVDQLQDQPALCVYVNGALIRDMVARTAEAEGEGAGPADPGLAGPPQMLIPLHLFRGIDAIAWSAGFDGEMWRTQAFIAAPAPRSGLAALLDAQPVSDEILRAIPQSAEWVTIRRLDLAKLHDEIRSAMEAGMADGGALFDKVMGGATMGLGANPKTTLFDPLGDEWAIYIAPQVAGDSLLGGVLLNRVGDAARVQRGLSAIAIAATNIATTQTPSEIRFQVGYHQHNGTRISYLATPVIAPAWAVKNNLLVMGFYPQTVAAALDELDADGSLLDNEAFQALRQTFGDRQITAISFVDLAKTAEKAYSPLLMWAQLYTGGADLFIEDMPPLLVPAFQHLRPHLSPIGRVAWVDEQGWHAQTVAPFPLADLLSGDASQIIQQYPLAASVMVPPLMRARQRADEIRSVANLRQLLAAMLMYAQDNDGRMPKQLTDLLPYAGNTPSVFVRPNQRIPAAVRNGTPEEIAQWLGSNAAYVYIRRSERLLEIRNPGEVIVLHERIDDRQPTSFVAVGFADGHAESMMVMRLQELLAAQQQGL